jgi:hypothetical protein
MFFNRAKAQRRKVLLLDCFFSLSQSSFENCCPSPDRSENPFVPVPRLREPQKIAADSRKQLHIQIPNFKNFRFQQNFNLKLYLQGFKNLSGSVGAKNYSYLYSRNLYLYIGIKEQTRQILENCRVGNGMIYPYIIINRNELPSLEKFWLLYRTELAIPENKQ